MIKDAKGRFATKPEHEGLTRKQIQALWRQRNAAHLAEYRKRDYAENAEKRREYSRNYGKQKYATNRAAILAKNKAWKAANPEKAKSSARKHYERNRLEILRKTTLYTQRHPEQRRASARRYTRKMLATPKGRVDHRMSVAILGALKANKNGRSWESLVGYTLADLMRHLESKFTSGMTWEKLLSGEIEIDHVVPKSKFYYATSDEVQFRQCWALENLQPMWVLENRSKGNRLETHTQIALGV